MSCSLHMHGSYLKGDVVKLAAVADGGSAGMDHTVHLNDARAAPRSFPDTFTGRAARRRAAGSCFTFGSLLARHFSRFPPEKKKKKVSSGIRAESEQHRHNLGSRFRTGAEKVAAAEKLNGRIVFTCALHACSSAPLQSQSRAAIVLEMQEALLLPLLLSRFLLLTALRAGQQPQHCALWPHHLHVMWHKTPPWANNRQEDSQRERLRPSSSIMLWIYCGKLSDSSVDKVTVWPVQKDCLVIMGLTEGAARCPWCWKQLRKHWIMSKWSSLIKLGIWWNSMEGHFQRCKKKKRKKKRMKYDGHLALIKQEYSHGKL